MGNPNKIKQVIVVRRDLKMRQGKAIAQGCHSVIATFWEYAERREPLPVIYWQWKRQWGEAKIAVQAESLEHLLGLALLAELSGLQVRKIIDSGLTEFNGVETMTCICIGPDVSSKIDPVTGNLKLL